MACNSIVSGKDGKVLVSSSAIARLNEWTFNPSVQTDRFGDSDSSGFQRTVPGTAGATGTLRGKFLASDPIYELMRQGDCVNLALRVRSAASGGVLYYYVPAVIQDFNIGSNPDTGVAVEWTATFESDGKWYYPGESGIPSVSF